MRKLALSLHLRVAEFKSHLIYRLNERRVPIEALNVGSGRRRWPGWVCLDEVQDIGVTKVHFDPRTVFPVASQSVSLVYSSHFLEHIPDGTVDQVLREIYRCLKPGGQLVIKIPDYDYFIDAYLSGNGKAFDGVGIEPVISTWGSRGVQDSVSSRFCMMLCGWMNSSYGAHFVNPSVIRKSDAYHGPPMINESALRELVEAHAYSPHSIVAALRELPLNEPDFSSFNHQNAWSANELTQLLSRHGFQIDAWTMESEREMRDRIPDLDNMKSWSLYTLARRPGC